MTAEGGGVASARLLRPRARRRCHHLRARTRVRPAYRALTVGDVITSIDGVPTTNPNALQAAIRSHAPGQTVTLQVGSIAHPTPGHTGLGPARLRPWTASKVVPVRRHHRPWAPNRSTTCRSRITINADQIGGPSAGLAWTLGHPEQPVGWRPDRRPDRRRQRHHPSRRHRGRRRRRASRRPSPWNSAGATVFLVPDSRSSVDPARAKATPNLKVFAVSSLGQALRDLESLGRAPRHRRPRATARARRRHSVPNDWQQSPWS